MSARRQGRSSPGGPVPPQSRLVPAVAGDRVPVVVRLRDRWVVGACGEPAKGWLCLGCAQLLANRGQLELHLETGQHVIARICAEHGVEAFEEPT